MKSSVMGWTGIGLVAMIVMVEACSTRAPIEDPDPTRRDTVVVPAGWFKGGADPDEFDAGIDTSSRLSGEAAGYIRLIDPVERSGYGTLMQQVSAEQFRGGRISLNGWARGEEIDGWAGLWIRVDGKGRTYMYDNMADRPIRGTTDWTECRLIVDVPDSAEVISFGLLLDGSGTLRADELRIEKVNSSKVACTNLLKKDTVAWQSDGSIRYAAMPTQLDFETHERTPEYADAGRVVRAGF